MEDLQKSIQPLFYEIAGPEVVTTRIPVYEVVDTLREYLYIIDRGYLTLTGKQRLSRKERESYKIIAYRFTPGSLLIDCAIELIDITQQAFPFLLPVGAQGIWNLTKASYNFLKIIDKFRANDIEPNVTEYTNANIGLQVDGHNVFVNQLVVMNAEKIEDGVKNISNHIRPGWIDKISLSDKEKEGVVITDDEKKLFNPETVISDNPETLIVNIYRLDKESKKGKLHILEGVVQKDMAFQIVGDQPIGHYIDALKFDRVKITVLRELANSLSGKQYTTRLQLIGLPNAKTEQKNLF